MVRSKQSLLKLFAYQSGKVGIDNGTKGKGGFMSTSPGQLKEKLLLAAALLAGPLPIRASSSGDEGLDADLSKLRMPDFYKNMKGPSRQEDGLDFYILEKNGERFSLGSGKTLDFFRGDRLKVLDVFLKNRKNNQNIEVNVVGFRADPLDPSRQDLNKLIDTSTHLDQAYWSVNPGSGADTFAVVSARGGRRLGMAWLRRTDPRLRYVDIRLNGEQKVMREGELIRIKSGDQFKVEKVVTNLKNLEHVRYSLARPEKHHLKNRKDLPKNADAFNLVFQHQSYVFASIPMLVENQ